jgi:hypothetical protein
VDVRRIEKRCLARPELAVIAVDDADEWLDFDMRRLDAHGRAITTRNRESVREVWKPRPRFTEITEDGTIKLARVAVGTCRGRPCARSVLFGCRHGFSRCSVLLSRSDSNVDRGDVGRHPRSLKVPEGCR